MSTGSLRRFDEAGTALRAVRSWARPALLIAVLAWTPDVRAIFGAGDIVFDPDNTAQTINVLRQVQQEYDRLGTLLGVSTRQFDQLVQLSAALGPAGAGAAPLSPAQMQAAVRAIPGLADADLGALFNTNGLLDAFLGVPLGQWALAVENPTAFLRDVLIGPAVARIGASAGLSPSSIAYAQWYAARTPEDQANLGARAAGDLSSLLASDWLQDSRTRRVNLQGLAAANQADGAKASQAGTIIDLERAHASLASDTNSILVEAAAQGAAAAENSVSTLQAQNRLLQEQADLQRGADELRLDGAW